jgi:PKD repeat protein
VIRNYFFPLARLARALITPRGGFVLLLAVVAGAGAVQLGMAATLDPTKPSASFTVSPDSPSSNDTVTFTSTSSPGLLGAPIKSEDWDLNNDGVFDDGTGSSAQRSFAAPGTYTVGLRVTDESDATDIATQDVTVQNRLPTANFSISPRSPSTLESVTFKSTSTDSDGEIASYAWDLNNDGNFDDGTSSEAQRSFPLAGTYTVKLLVTDNNGGQDISTQTVDVGNQPPVASFDYAPSSPSTGEEITLTSTSTDPDGSISSYSWDLNGDNIFGDADTAQAKVTFANVGNHTVRLRVTDSDGTSTTTSQVIGVANHKPTASFDVSPQSPTTGEQVTFTSTSTDPDGTIASYAWDLNNDGQFDDGNKSKTKTSFATQGTHTVRLQVTDNNGDTDIATGSVDVGNRGPTASFDVSPQSPQTGQQVTLTSTATDRDGTIASYSWDLNEDGTFGDATASQAQTTFATPGNHTVKLQVTDNNGATDVASRTIVVANRAPTASFGYSPQSPKTLEQVTFTSTATDPDGTIASVAWDLDNDGQFDDGATGTAQTSFATGGTHVVKLRVTDDNGASDSASLDIVVANRGPTASFTSSPAAPKTGEQVTFTSTATDPDGTIAGIAWDLDNNGTFETSGATAQRSFATVGTYTVQQRVTDSSGATALATGTVTIANRAPTAAFGFAPSSPKTGDEITLTSSSTDPDGSISSYSWDLNGDGTFGDSTLPSPKTTFATPGNHTVKLQVTDNNGATDVAQVTIIVANRPPTASFDIVPANPKTLELVTFTSTATDPDGTIASVAWDLDNDGQFNDGATAQVQRSFPVAGTYTIKLKVTDSNGATDIATKPVTATNQPPKASFTTSPDAPTTDGPVTFSSTSTDPEGLPLTLTWDLDNNGTFESSGASVQKQFTAPGTYTFKLNATDASGASDVATGTVALPNRPPTATVDHEPKNPQTGTAIKFTATSNDPENRVKSIAWAGDGDDQFNDGNGQTFTKTFKKPAAYTVKFRIEDLDGSTTVAEDVVAVGNQAPKSDFVVLPESPVSGSPATLVSTALDPDTPLDKWLWDLNGDGVYGDAEGASVQHVFPTPGSYTVGLKVLDSEDVADFAVKTIVVHAPVAPALTAPLAAAGPSVKLLSPFPVVRLAGRISNNGTRLRLFSIEAPPGARVVVTCRGRSCPFRLSARSAVAEPGKGKVHSSASLRIRQLEKRLLKKGVRVTIYVTKPGTIGKYVRFKFLRRRPPARVDKCLMPSAPNKPVECPS